MANNTQSEKYRLVYFDIRALAEPIRMIFAYSDTPFIDERIPWDYQTWFTSTKPKYSSTVGQIPILHQDGKRELCQSQVISRYLAKQYGLVADNDWDNARLDEVISMAYDLFIVWRIPMFTGEPGQKKVFKEKVDAKIPLYYQKFSEILQEEKGDFILGSKVTHADFWLANIVSMLDEPFSGNPPVMPPGLPPPEESDIYVGLTSEYPLLKMHQKAVENLPGVKEWIAKRHNTIL